MTELTGAPDGYVAVLPSVPREHGLVVQGLLDSNGIPTVLVAARSGAHVYTREPSHVVSVYVAADRADEARALLESGPADREDGGT
jgi:hypothetical protein